MNFTLIAGSNRKDATSTRLLRYIGQQLEAGGHNVVLFDLWESPLPFFTPDSESDDPNVRLLLAAVNGADGLVLGTPEYHGSISGVLKNALDYLGSEIVGGKPVLSVSSSGGEVGVASLTQLQGIVRNLHGINCPDWISIGGSSHRFGDDGEPSREQMRGRVRRGLDSFVALVSALRAGVAR